MSESFKYGLPAAATEYDGINKYLRITDIDNDSRLFKIDKLTSPNFDLNGADDYLLQYGDVLFANTGASVGKSYFHRDICGKVYFAGYLVRLRIKKEHFPKFVYQITFSDEYDKKILITSQRSAQPGVNAKEYSNFKFYIPFFKEQVKIGQLLEKFDSLITLYQRK
ncbi:restriction endonuclease subunit S, partial [Mycoplasma testudineum]